ncbi:MAG: ABC transporter substrate-binding protein [Candidatus Saccharicenans sp.]
MISLKERRLFLLLWVLIAAFFFCLISLSILADQSGSVRPKPGGVLRIRPYGRTLNTDLDPAGNGYPVVIEHLYEGLVRLDQNLAIFPGLAEYWTSAEGGKKITFYLRKEAVFHNGQEVTAEDVKFSFERLFQLKHNPLFYLFATRIEGGEEYWSGSATEVKGLKVVDAKTLEITWKQPNVSNFYFLAASFAKVLPKNLVLNQKKRFFEKPVGAGPFKFDYWLRSSRLEVIGIRLIRNERYFDRKPLLEAIEISPYYSLENFLEDEVQVIPYLSYRISRGRYQVLESNLLHLTYLFFSCHLPPFDRPEVRRALKFYLDKSELASLVSTSAYFGQVVDNYIPPFLPDFVPEIQAELLNQNEVKEVLASAGAGSLDNPLKVNLLFSFPNQELAKKIYEELRNQLAPAGIRLELKNIESLEQLQTEKTPYLLYFDWLLELPDPEFLIQPLFHSGAFLNRSYFHYQNQQLDELLEAEKNTASFDRRISLFRQIENLLREEVPAIPLYYFRQRLAYQPYVKNLKSQVTGSLNLNLREAWIDR